MKDLKGTKTEQNLMTAFAGESQARNKYTYLSLIHIWWVLLLRGGRTASAELFCAAGLADGGHLDFDFYRGAAADGLFLAVVQEKGKGEVKCWK